MLRLFGFPGAASLAPHILLEELGLPYEMVVLDAGKQEHKSAEYLKLNPHGRVPTLVDADEVLYEAAAICLALAERVPAAGLIPEGPAERAQLYKWMMFLTNTLQPALVAYFYPDRLTNEADGVAAIKLRAEQNALQIYKQIDADLAARGPYLLGQQLSVADFFLLMLVRWGRWFATPPATQFAHIAALVETLSARPAVQRSFAQENIPAPYCLLPKQN